MPGNRRASYGSMTRTLRRSAPLLGLILAACAAREAPPPATIDPPSTQWEAGARGQGPRCVGLARPDELLCRADRLLIQARSGGDPDLLACYRQRGAELRAGYRSASDTRARLGESAGNHTLERARLEAAEDALERSYVRLASCQRPVQREADSLRVTVPPLPADG